MKESSFRKGYGPEDVFEELNGESPNTAFFSTFTFSPAVFHEKYVLPLLRLGCGNIAVLTDPLGYSQSLSVASFAEGIGTDYRLRSVPLSGAFHAKLALIRCRGFMLVGVGSGNLTASGLLTNAEVSALYRIQNVDSLTQLDNLVSRLSMLAGLSSNPGIRSLPIPLTEDSRLITSLDDPIFSQCNFPTDVELVEIVSPFVDEQLLALAYIRDRWPEARIRLRIDPAFGFLNEALLEFGSNVEIFVPKEPVENNGKKCRPLVHGKLMCFIGAELSTVLLGSANLSRPASMSTENFEAVVERSIPSTEAKQLLKTPNVQWRKATREDRTAGSKFTSIQSVAPLNARVSEHRIEVTWSATLPTMAILKLSRRGRCVLTSTLQSLEKNGRTQSASSEISDEVIQNLDGPATAELNFSDGRIARGWIDIADRLGITPALKRQFSLLNAIISDPEECTVKDVADFIEQLQRNLQQGRRMAMTRPSRRSDESDEAADDALIDRSSLLIEGGVSGIDGALLFERLIRRKMNQAINELSFFRSGLRTAGRTLKDPSADPDSSNDQISTTEKGRLPPRIATVLSELFRQLASAIEECDSAATAAYYVCAIPNCIDAMRFAITKWSAELHVTDLLSQNFDKVISACCAPGVRSVFQRSGSLKLFSEDDRNRWNDTAMFADGIAALESGLLIDFHTEQKQRHPLIRDMYDVLKLFKLPGPEELQSVAGALWKLAGRGLEDSPNFADLRQQIETVRGEESAILGCREALHQLVLTSHSGSLDRQQQLALARTAANGNIGDADLLLTLIRESGNRICLVEVPIDENACPKCDITLPGSVQNQLKSPTAFWRCSNCGRLLVRSLEL